MRTPLTEEHTDWPPGEHRRSLADMYGYAFRLVVDNGGDPQSVTLIYQMSDGRIGVEEDASLYFSTPATWWPSDVVGCRWAEGRVLDIHCGAGRHALAVAADGHEVVGLEPSVDAVIAARRRGVDARVGDIHHPPNDLGKFDTLLMLGGGLGLLGAEEDPKTTLSALASIAAPGAQIVGNFAAGCVHERRFEPLYSTDHRRSLYRLRVRHGSELTEWSDWGGVSYMTPEQLIAAVIGTAWHLTDICRPTWYDVAGDSGNAYDYDALGLYLARLRLAEPEVGA